MVQLYINSELVALPEDQRFTFTKNNPLFTKDSSFTYDIRLSLKNTVNARIFGPVAHKSVGVYNKKYYADLVVDGRTMLNGYAKITSIDDVSVNVQLIDMSNRTKDNWKNLYIDQLNIGRAIDFQTLGFELGVERLGSSYDPTRWEGSSDPNDFIIDAHIERTFGHSAATQTAGAIFDHESSEGNVVVKYEDMMKLLQYRNYNFSREILFCPVEISNKREGGAFMANDFRYDESSGEWKIPNTSINRIREYRYFAPQLKLYYVVQKVLEAIGYKVVYNCLEHDKQIYDVFVANATITNILSHTLPHWTVEKFINEVENFASVLFEFSGNKASVVQMVKKDELNNNVVTLNTTEQYTKRVEQKKNNIRTFSYDIKKDENNGYDFLPKDIFEQCVIIDIDSPDEIEALYNNGGKARQPNAIFKSRDKQTCYYRDRLGVIKIVNEFRDSADEGEVVNLGIKPATIYDSRIGNLKSINIYGEGEVEQYMMPMETFSLEEYFISGEQEEFKGRDEMKVAIFDGISLRVPMVCTAGWQHLFYNYGIDWQIENSLCLYRDDSAISHKRFNLAEYDISIVYTFYFVADEMPPVDKIFLIQGKKYFAKSLSCEVNGQNYSHMFKGEFYQII